MPATHLPLVVLAMDLHEVLQHLHGEVLRREVLHIQIDDELVSVRSDLEPKRPSCGSARGRGSGRAGRRGQRGGAGGSGPGYQHRNAFHAPRGQSPGEPRLGTQVWTLGPQGGVSVDCLVGDELWLVMVSSWIGYGLGDWFWVGWLVGPSTLNKVTALGFPSVSINSLGPVFSRGYDVKLPACTQCLPLYCPHRLAGNTQPGSFCFWS